MPTLKTIPPKRTLFIQFAKWPVPGKVKTRLMAEFSAVDAARIHCELSIRTLSQLAELKEAEMQLHLDRIPASRQEVEPVAEALWDQCAARTISIHSQITGDLGIKMQHALEQGLRDFDSVILVGSDCPVMDAAYLAQAKKQLEQGAEVVLGPAEDGGYVLIGVRRFEHGIFDQVAWGGPEVLAQTTANLDRLGMRYALLPLTWDVDHPQDYRRWRQLEQART